jgi:hypothetical protein
MKIVSGKGKLKTYKANVRANICEFILPTDNYRREVLRTTLS